MPAALVNLPVLAAVVFSDDGAGTITLHAAQGISSVVFGAGPPGFYDITPDPEVAGGFPTGVPPTVGQEDGFLPDARVLAGLSGGGGTVAVSSTGVAWRIEVPGSPLAGVPITFVLRRMTTP